MQHFNMVIGAQALEKIPLNLLIPEVNISLGKRDVMLIGIDGRRSSYRPRWGWRYVNGLFVEPLKEWAMRTAHESLQRQYIFEWSLQC